uniref:Endonuclease/exonuclease/phosphatase domain-containing protein n=1 Tax=Oncorhynchus mykiss TaxID=8022 RepID=A0A8K9Y355_ONCMY
MPTILSPNLILCGYCHSRVYPPPPQADTTTALKELHWTLCKLKTIYPEAAFIVAGDFNKSHLRTRLPKFYPHIDCSTGNGKTLDHCYSNFCDAYKALPPPDKSDHDSILHLPSYRQKLKQDVPVTRTIQCWSDQSESTLQDCFGHADWDMFQVALENNIDLYAGSVSEFIRKCKGDVVPTVTIKTYPNQKPCRCIRTKLKARPTAFNHGRLTGNMAEYKQCCYSLHKAIKQAKCQYRDKVESQFNGSDTTHMWQGLKKISHVRDTDVLLPDKLKTKRHIWRKPGTIPTVKHGGSRIMLWGCLSAVGNGRLVRIEENMYGAKYREILDENLIQSSRDLRLGRWFTSNRTTTLRTQPRQRRCGFGTSL